MTALLVFKYENKQISADCRAGGSVYNRMSQRPGARTDSVHDPFGDGVEDSLEFH